MSLRKEQKIIITRWYLENRQYQVPEDSEAESEQEESSDSEYESIDIEHTENETESDSDSDDTDLDEISQDEVADLIRSAGKNYRCRG